MSALITELHDLVNLYLRMDKDLAKITDISDPNDIQALVESILRNRNCLTQIEQMNARVLQLSEDWEISGGNLDPKSRDEARTLAATAKAHAIRMNEFCAINIQKLEAAREKLGKELAEIGKGNQYLKSVKPIKNNYPKFIDSVY